MKVKDVDNGVLMIKNRLGHKKILLVLDDVNELDQLNKLVAEHNWFGPGSRIIITTRDVQDTIRLILNTKMAQGTSVREHFLKMISYLNTLEVLGADIDGESQGDMILQSLPESFKEFKLNYNMNKKIYTLFELMNELVAAEDILGTANINANMAEAFSSQPKSKGKGGKKKDFTKQDGK